MTACLSYLFPHFMLRLRYGIFAQKEHICLDFFLKRNIFSPFNKKLVIFT